MLRQGLQTALRMIYPPRCLGCGGLVETDFGLCGSCWRDAPFITGLSCDLCGVPLPGTSQGIEHCDHCLKAGRPWERGCAALVYKGTARKLILGLKHGDRHDVVAPAALWMARVATPITSPQTLVVPIPLHFRRLVKRRYNQSALLAKALAQHLDCAWCPDALRRRIHTPSLEGQSPAQRAATLGDAIECSPNRRGLVAGRNILLVDDVMTTGATLAAAAEVCTAAGAASVCMSVLARVAKDA